jgi:molybdopterin converting factor small subunit
MPRVIVPPPYQGPTQGVGRLDVEGETVRACLEAVEARHPGFFDLVAGADGVPHRFVRLFQNGDKLGDDALEAKLATDDELEIIAAIAGG